MLLCLPAQGPAQIIVLPDTSFVDPISPTAAGISIQQVNFTFDAGRASYTDWGQIQIDPVKWGNATGLSQGYIHLLIHPDSSVLRAKWVVRNLFLPASLVTDCPADASDPSPAAGPRRIVHPISMYFDLRPWASGSGRLTSLSASVLVSRQPLPEVGAILTVLLRSPPQRIGVEQITVNAEGFQGESAPAEAGPVIAILGAGDDLVGLPPLPPDPSPGPALPGDLAFPIEVIQSEQPNVNTAKNQCVPMAQANVFGYLEERYNALPLLWDLPHVSTAGIGKITSVGDVIFWVPQPQNSLVANVDALTRRQGVTSSSTGEGSSICQLIHGALGYIGLHGAQAVAEFRHQGGSELYSEEADCNDITVVFNGLVSVREGLHPTWQWMFDQLQLGRGVSMCFGRYDINGNRTSGHMVRVWGARRFNGRDYLYTLDDSNQGANSTGLRTQQWEVADTGQPGLAGLPDGRLNMNGSSWEIEFAISAEAKPTLLIP